MSAMITHPGDVRSVRSDQAPCACNLLASRAELVSTPESDVIGAKRARSWLQPRAGQTGSDTPPNRSESELTAAVPHSNRAHCWPRMAFVAARRTVCTGDEAVTRPSASGHDAARRAPPPRRRECARSPSDVGALGAIHHRLIADVGRPGVISGAAKCRAGRGNDQRRSRRALTADAGASAHLITPGRTADRERRRSASRRRARTTAARGPRRAPTAAVQSSPDRRPTAV